jgi:LacI family transcriptional regulator
VTSHDVAKLAGVSQTTVSLVFSGSAAGTRVGPATRARVLDAARTLGYEPNAVARALVQGRSRSVGIAVPTLRDPFFLDVVSGAQRVLRAEGYAVLLAEADESASMTSAIALFRARQIDGLLIDPVGLSAVDPSALQGAPVVLIDDQSDRWPGVRADAERAGRIVAEHLLALGHRRLGFLGPLTEMPSAARCERGFARVLREAGVAPRSAHVRRVPATVEGGKAGMQALLALAERPTAVFCANDLIALGALKSCVRAHVHVPDEMSIVGCGDIESATLVTPELTTVNLRPLEVGARAARLLLELVDGAPPRAMKPLPVELVVRGTTAPPPVCR